MKICVAFYKGTGNVFNAIIRKWTKSTYSHAELILADGQTWISITPFLKSKIYSQKNPDYDEKEWDFIDLDVTEEQHGIIEEFYSITEGCSYDWPGMLLSQFLPFRIKTEGKWYCSEWIAYALRISGVIDWKTIKIFDKSDLSPSVLYRIVQEVARSENKKVQSR